MSAHVMHQQINLYQPLIIRGNGLLKSNSISIALVAVVVVVLATYAYGQHAVHKLAQHVDEAREQQQKQTALLTLNAANADPKQLTEMQTQLKALNATLADHRRALQLLRVGAVGGDSGFSERLVALASQHIDGMWLNHIVLGSDNGVDSLGGGAINAELIPRYLSSLAAEPALRGTRINQFDIKGKEDGSDSDHPGASFIQFNATRIMNVPEKEKAAGAETSVEPAATTPDDTATDKPATDNQLQGGRS